MCCLKWQQPIAEASSCQARHRQRPQGVAARVVVNSFLGVAASLACCIKILTNCLNPSGDRVDYGGDREGPIPPFFITQPLSKALSLPDLTNLYFSTA